MDKDRFRQELESLINSCSIENESNTPDWMLADYLMTCLDDFADVMTKRDKWYGINQRMEITELD